MNANAPLQVVYALTSSGNDWYSQQTFVSASLVRRLYPGVAIILVLDEATSIALRAAKDPVLQIATQVVEMKTGMEHPVMRNRMLKTSLRQHLDGPILYLDADTMPIRRFDELFQHDADVAGVNDYTEGLYGFRRSTWVRDLYQTMHWRYPSPQYLNGGVLYMADRPGVRRFAELWNVTWQHCVEKANLSLDQPSLNRAIVEAGMTVRRLDERFNCPVGSTLWPVRKAKIFHFFASQASQQRYAVLDHLVMQFAETGQINWRLVEWTAKTGDPYVESPPQIKACLTSGRWMVATKRFGALLRERTFGRFDKIRSTP